jgi:NAD(P)-dependent dehydrogenase (short-subunit alcohol dehydrogenase family)
MDRIRGRTVVITGAARGIGRATAEALLVRGARVVIGDRDVAVRDATASELNRLGQVSGYPLDVTDAQSFAVFLDKARADGAGRIDVLVVGLSTALSDEFAPQGVDVGVVMPTVTDTELIAGTKAGGAQKPVQPADIAAAVVKVLDKPTTAVSVPRPLRRISILSQLLPARGRRWLSHKMGNDTVFMNFDAVARAGYENCAQSATGVLRDQ